MNIKDQVCTLEQAKELKKLGIVQESFFTWYGGFEGSEVEPNVDLTDQRMYDVSVNGWYGHPDNTYSAFTVAELGLMLGNERRHCYFILDESTKALLCHLDYGNVYYGTFYTEAEALAQLLIDLIKAKMKAVVLINDRLRPETVSHSIT